MANTKALSKEERKKAKRTSRKKRRQETPRIRARLKEAQSEEDGTRNRQALTVCDGVEARQNRVSTPQGLPAEAHHAI